MPMTDENPPGPACPVTARLRLRPRSLHDAGLDGPPATVYKDDARSRVWSTEHVAYGLVVVKQFTYSSARQRAARVAGIHPAQCEAARNHQLRTSGVPVVPLVDGGEERAGFGRRIWLATPFTGISLQHRITDPAVDDVGASELIDAAARLTRKLLKAGYTFKDLKPSNIIIDGAGVMHLIDVGSAKPSTRKKQVARMLAVMDRVLKRNGIQQTLCERYRRSVLDP